MEPSFSKIAASASFSLEPGIFTVSNCAELALRIRVSMSAIGSVIVTAPPPSPARLGHAGHLSGVNHRPKADPAQAELAEDRLGSTAPLASRVRPDLVLGDPLLLLDECLLCHFAYRVSCRKGKPKACRKARPPSSSFAVVTIVMSMPRTESTRS